MTSWHGSNLVNKVEEIGEMARYSKSYLYQKVAKSLSFEINIVECQQMKNFPSLGENFSLILRGFFVLFSCSGEQACTARVSVLLGRLLTPYKLQRFLLRGR